MSELVHQCERWRNCHIWWSGNWESQTNTCEFYSGIVQGYRNEISQWVGGKRSHGTSDVSNVSSEGPFFNVWPKVGKSHGTPYLDVDYDGQKRQLVNLLYNLLMSSVIMGMSKRRMESSSIDTRLYVNITGITYSSLNVLTAKVRSVRPWSSRFNLVSQCLTTFQTWWSYFPTLEGDIPHRCDTWGPIALLESPHLVLIWLFKHSSYTTVHLPK